jgi:hypothetical protein
MDWVLFVAIASMSPTDNKAVTTTTVPMASVQLCNAAKAKLSEAYKTTQSPNFLFVGECLQAR